jgi:hypothetical protein
MDQDEKYAYALFRNKSYWRGIIVCAVIGSFAAYFGLLFFGTKIGNACWLIFALEALCTVVYFVILSIRFCRLFKSGDTPDFRKFQQEMRCGLHKTNRWTGI